MRVAEGGLNAALANLGNVPGEHAGDIVLRLPSGASYTVPSADVTLYAEGIRAHLPDGRGLFVHISGAEVIDAPHQADDEPAAGEAVTTGVVALPAADTDGAYQLAVVTALTEVARALQQARRPP